MLRVIGRIKEWARQIKFKVEHSSLLSQNTALLAALIIFLVCTYLSVMSMSRNWELAETLAREKGQLELLQANIDTMELENAYYRSEEYQELMARKLLDKKMPGENMVVMPENSASAQAKHQVAKVETEEQEKTNFEQWMMYLFPSY